MNWLRVESKQAQKDHNYKKSTQRDEPERLQTAEIDRWKAELQRGVEGDECVFSVIWNQFFIHGFKYE